MKKVLAFILAAMMTLTLASCSGKFATVQDYVNTPVIKAVMDQTEESATGDDSSLTITGEGNSLVYTYTFAKQMDAEVTKTALESATEEQISTFESLASDLEDIIVAENPTVIVKYLNADGSELYSREFTAE